MKTCLLCNKPANSREHYIPVWLSDRCGTLTALSVNGLFRNGEELKIREGGNFSNARSHLLCAGCNSDLGRNLEAPVAELVTPLLRQTVPSLEPIQGWGREVNLLTQWMCLRALEADAVLQNGDLSEAVKVFLKNISIAARDGHIYVWPLTLELELAFAKDPAFGLLLSKSFFEPSGNTVQSKSGGFWLGGCFQHVLLWLAHTPGAVSARGYGGAGMRLFPAPGPDKRGIRVTPPPVYQNLRDWLQHKSLSIG
jgi:hypothetical protein